MDNNKCCGYSSDIAAMHQYARFLVRVFVGWERVGVLMCTVNVVIGLLTQVARAEDNSSPELIQPPICSPLKPIPPGLKDYCEITTLPGAEHHKIKVNLTAQTSPIEVGGYTVETEHYNYSYLTPVIEALPGDTVAAHLVNSLKPRAMGGAHIMAHEDAGENPTNLHYFHGGIVSPNNDRPRVQDARNGTGDNIYVWLKNGPDSKPVDFEVPIPGKDELDARVLEGTGKISHPTGLNWYHSHLHGISSDQVMGGMSGLLSVGEDKAAVKAQCKPYTDADKCKNDTDELQKRTIVRYAMLRDISLMHINALPTENIEPKTAEWAPDQRDFSDVCKVWPNKDSPESSGDSTPELRKGFCQRRQDSAWLFTMNGQRFPKITVENESNLLLRLGNLSPNVAYWLELVDETTKQPIALNVLSLDGVVPARPVDSKAAKIPVDAISTNDLLLMPASRAEIYVRNDLEDGHTIEQHLILRTKGLDAGFDQWPAIQLARIVLRPSKPTNAIALALNVPTSEISPAFAGEVIPGPEPTPPNGCVRDLDPKKGEHRRILFEQATKFGSTLGAKFAIKTEIVKPPGPGSHEEKAFKTDDIATTVEASFEEYEYKQTEGSINWDGDGKEGSPKHVCINLNHEGSHKQLWVLTNKTTLLHNFHIHQMKFRLATLAELNEHHITPPAEAHTCDPKTECNEPDYKLYDDNPNPKTIWHDTIPVPDGRAVFIIMSFDAPQQVGRFVYHCHILKHEDKGLMAPIEVWKSSAADFLR